ncbi:glycoside hydrolase family 88/105 protein [Paenibacillus arenilitoris]|uniref:Glycoside hydrolase family 88 protein n=1 Tax=Paenibacillus arenilitoris TaxID=2772299 RepID=A0A927CJM0_9BACL|nr:glycoside hydrolase family 88 protein [Paenibacillus arenilitoris]MBD2868734.1 glycoside hydrolase family 88 protein [Paenibacillus arenilitoris]
MTTKARSGGYVDPSESMAAQTDGLRIPHVLETMARRYVGDNPPHEPVFRVARTSEIRKLPNHLYEFPAGKMFPSMREGQRVYAWAKLWIDRPHDFVFLLRCFGPVRLYHNGEKRYGSSTEETAASGGPEVPPLKLKVALTSGWNHFVLELGKDGAGGCGAEFGTGSRKNKPFHFLAPTGERDGEEGWIYTEPRDEPLAGVPERTMAEASTGAEWLPARTAVEEGRLERLYGTKPGHAAYAWTKVLGIAVPARRVELTGTAYGPVRFAWNGEECHSVQEAGEFAFAVDAPPEGGDLIAECVCGDRGWGFRLQEPAPETGAALAVPRPVRGHEGKWLHLGPFAPGTAVNAGDYLAMDAAAEGGGGASFFWTTGEPGACIRPFLENELFGRWNYPLGVTLTGLLETGGLLGRGDLADYVLRHVEFATSFYAYSLWDRERFGAAGLNNQLSDIDSLDDCGSFGALAILAGRHRPLKGARAAADDIARYIMRVQDRMEDGALYRRVGVSPSMHNTMWCDDMYMSVPFLCRYAELSGDSGCLNEAARQLLLYKQYLYMPEKRIMSHVYDVAAGKPSRTAWGRGNGWVFFSLAVLLGALPQAHASRPAILAFYRELAGGYLALQGESGLWHQVLTDPESYEESSCTSMFMYGFALGVRHGWLADPQPYARAALAGWRGLCERAIDARGNLYGVCKGSSWSYSHAYYKHELGWNLNDTHGIGIVLLAGIETHRMKEWLGGRG